MSVGTGRSSCPRTDAHTNTHQWDVTQSGQLQKVKHEMATSSGRLWTWVRRVLDAWTSLHVEFQGCYDTKRLLQLQDYAAGLSTARLVLVCLLTPLPSLCLSLLSDAVPLPPTEAGVTANWFLFVRSWVLTAVIGAAVLVQIDQGVTPLKMTLRQVSFISMLAATVAIAFVALLCHLIVFPLPFGTLFAGPPCVLIIGAGVVILSRPHLRANPSLWNEIKGQLDVFYCQTALTFIYPLYIYGYVSLSGLGQASFVLLSPVIQIIAKNWISRKLTHHDYMKPETVVFSVEVMNALYSSSVLQGTSSWKSTVLIMGTDIVQFGLAMFDMMKLLEEVRVLMKRIPREHPLAKENFVQIAERLTNINSSVISSRPKSDEQPTHGSTCRKQIKTWVNLTQKSKSVVPRETTMQLKSGPLIGKQRLKLDNISQSSDLPDLPTPIQSAGPLRFSCEPWHIFGYWSCRRTLQQTSDVWNR
ncbi:unnamed protein product [Phytophthora fragariaefolia]|uniref:Unnamed protein product n=1 Tax=Phytophthora fragariaefolia TaxID=1490495 RepID=A0A9W6Y813_9STRA|nr:unnamed protein product [Phytophthora fragariaefolia]